MQVRVRNTLRDLAKDARAVPAHAYREMVSTVREGVKIGSRLAKENARRSSGAHGKHYPKSITSEIKSMTFGAIVGEYGPERDRLQGGMSFEEGSRNQPPHRDLAKSLDVVGPAFVGEVRRIPGKVFW